MSKSGGIYILQLVDNKNVENKKFILDMTKEALEKAPGMDKNKWPDEINFELIGKAYSHFGVAPYWDSSYPKP